MTGDQIFSRVHGAFTKIDCMMSSKSQCISGDRNYSEHAVWPHEIKLYINNKIDWKINS